jgi:hypothetical protein
MISAANELALCAFIGARRHDSVRLTKQSCRRKVGYIYPIPKEHSKTIRYGGANIFAKGCRDNAGLLFGKGRLNMLGRFFAGWTKVVFFAHFTLCRSLLCVPIASSHIPEVGSLRQSN